jgi:hypothetical protein
VICPKCGEDYTDWGKTKHYMCRICFNTKHRLAQQQMRESMRGQSVDGIITRKCLRCYNVFTQPHINYGKTHVFCDTCREKIRLAKREKVAQEKVRKQYEPTDRNTVPVCHKNWYCLESDELAPGYYYEGDVLYHLKGLNGKFRDNKGLICVATNGRFTQLETGGMNG